MDFIVDALELRSELHVLNETFTDPRIVKVKLSEQEIRGFKLGHKRKQFVNVIQQRQMDV